MCKMGVLLARTVTKRYNKKKGERTMARRRKKRRKPFRVPAGFARKDLKSRVLYILHRQKGEPLEVNALEAQAQVKRDQHEDYVQLLSQME